jgi:siroheme synthase (precorrin-2 oxidase/ferrochelatase)
MHKKNILIQLDCDDQPSVFDRVVAVDSGADFIFSHASTKPSQVRDLIHGAIFTRGAKDLKHTAVFVGGSDVLLAKEIHDEVRKHMIQDYGLTVSSMMDANGCNTTAVAAVKAVKDSVEFQAKKAIVLAATGPVGQRVSSLLARIGCEVTVVSRQLEKALAICDTIRAKRPNCQITAKAPKTQNELKVLISECQILVSCGAAGIQLAEKTTWLDSGLEIAIDLNGVPPSGVEGIEPFDNSINKNGVVCYGAMGVGGFKMKLHRKCLSSMFESNQLVLDEDTIFDLSDSLS